MGPTGPEALSLTLDVPPNRVSLLRMGSGPPLILYHGALISRILWKPCIPILAKQFTVIAPDLPGHGKTETPEHWVPDLVAFSSDLLRALGFERAHWIGSSFGGGVLIRLAAERPQAVDRLVLVSPAGWPGEQVRKLSSLLEKPSNLWDSFREQFEDASLATRELFWRLERLARRAAPFFVRYRAALPDDFLKRGWLEEMARIQAPTLVVWGQNDRLLPFEFAERVTAAIPGARLHAIPKTRHFPFYEQPEAFCRDVLPFLEGRAVE